MIFTHFDTLAKSDKFARNDLFSGINPFSTSYFEAIFHYLNKIGCSSAYTVSFQKVVKFDDKYPIFEGGGLKKHPLPGTERVKVG